MRDTVVRTLIELAKQDRDIELITGDLGFGVLKPYWESVPDQFTNAGIAEQNMTTVAAGMAMEGKKVFTYSIGNFPTIRCLEQIRNDCAYHRANVNIICIGGGFVYGSLGMSHQATEDIAILRALPEVAVFCPGDPVEAEKVVRTMVDYPGTCYLRLGRGGEKNIQSPDILFKVGKAIKVRESLKAGAPKIVVFSTGAILEETCAACDELESHNISIIQYSFPTVKPIDKETILMCMKECDYIVTVEEHNLSGGFGSAVSEIMAENRGKALLVRIGIQDVYCERVGNQKYLRQQYGLDRDAIVRRVLEVTAYE